MNIFTKYRIMMVGLLCALQLAMPLSALAQSSDQTVPLQTVECDADDLYEFQSVHVNVGPQEKTYQAGDVIEFKGTLINDNDYPVIDGTVFVRIGKNNPNYVTDGHNTVAEFAALSGVSIPENTSAPAVFTWTVPKSLGAGSYRADYFFSVGNKYNLGGLPFTNEIVVGFSDFTVQNTEVTQFVLDRTATEVNGEKYFHVGNWPLVAQTEKVTVTQPLQNLLDKDIALDVSYDLYYWDSLNPQDKITTKTEKVVVPAKSAITLSYTIDTLTKPVYYLKIKASAGDVASIANIRVVTDVAGARINYPALTQFPLRAGVPSSIFSCFHGISSDMPAGTLTLELLDKAGKSIASGSYTGDIGTAMSAVQGGLSVTDDYDFATLKAVLKNDKGEVVDQYQATYDCAVIQSDACREIMGTEMARQISIFAGIVLVLALLSVWWARRYTTHPVMVKAATVFGATIALIAVIVIALVTMRGVDFLQAETVSADGKTKTETRAASWKWGWTRQGDSRNVGNGTVSYTHNVRLNGETTINVGNSVNFSRTGACTFNGSGGAWDTPNCGTALSLSSGGLSASITFPNVTPSMTITSANPSVLSCSGTTCTGKAAGTAVVTATLSSLTFAPTGCAATNNVGTICHNSGNDGRRLKLFSGGSYSASSLTLPEYRTSWTITVGAPSTAGGQCGAQVDTCTRGTFSRVPADTESSSGTVTDRWTCLGGASDSSADDAVCSLRRNSNGGGGNGGDANSTSNKVFPSAFDPRCVARPDNIAIAGNSDYIVYSVIDRNGSDMRGYNFTWSLQGGANAGLSQDNSAAAQLDSDTPITIPFGGVSVTIFDANSAQKNVPCPSAQFTDGIKAVFAKPIVEPGEMCTLSWSGIDFSQVQSCKIYNNQNIEVTEGDITGKSSGELQVIPNDKYYIKCQSIPDPADLETQEGFIQSEFLSCIRRGSLIEI